GQRLGRARLPVRGGDPGGARRGAAAALPGGAAPDDARAQPGLAPAGRPRPPGPGEAAHARRHGAVPGTAVPGAGGAPPGRGEPDPGRRRPAGELPAAGPAAAPLGAVAARRAGGDARALGQLVRDPDAVRAPLGGRAGRAARRSGRAGRGPRRVTPIVRPGTGASVVVVGGGATGLSAAGWLARAGVDVLVLEQGIVGWEASGRNGGGATHVYSPLGLEEQRLWPQMDGLLGYPTEYQPERIKVALSEDQLALYRQNAAIAAARGFRTEPLDRAQLRALVPLVGDSAIGGLHLL